MSEGTSLSAQLSVIGATLRADAKDRAAQAGAIAALQALLLALLVRLFSRFEKMVALWEAGLLPPPAPRTTHARHTAATHGSRRAVTRAHSNEAAVTRAHSNEAAVTRAHSNEAAVTRAREDKQESMFFFEKKNQKTFIRLGRTRKGRTRPKRIKFFCFFLFTKRRFFLFSTFPSSSTHARFITLSN